MTSLISTALTYIIIKQFSPKMTFLNIKTSGIENQYIQGPTQQNDIAKLTSLTPV